MNGLVLCTEQCNLRCGYCFEKHMRGPEIAATALVRTGFEHFIDTHLERFVVELLRVNKSLQRRGTITFHGGEPLLVGGALLGRALQIVGRHPGLEIGIQTNATLVTDEIMDLLIEHRVTVGVSIDGPRDMHDRYRVNGAGGGSWESTMASITKMRQRGILVGALATVTDATVNDAQGFYDFFRQHQLPFSFSPCFEDPGAPNEAGAPSLTDYMRFTRQMFDIWINDSDSDISIGCFERIMSAMCVKERVHMEVCTFLPDCSRTTVAIDTSGDLYRCLHYCMDKSNRIGNIAVDPLSTAVDDEAFSTRWAELGTTACRGCDIQEFCYGGCPYVAEAVNGSIVSKANTCAAQRDVVHHIRQHVAQFEKVRP